MAAETLGQRPYFPGRAPIDAYGNGGFRFAEMSHRGSILCLPSGIWGWEPAAMAHVSLQSLSGALAEAGKINLLLMGTGHSQVFPARELKRAFEASGIALEAMTTGAAARTYNVLLAEERLVGAALLAVE